MNHLLRISIISSLVVGLYACIEVHPVLTPPDPLEPNIQPPIVATRCPMLAEKYLDHGNLKPNNSFIQRARDCEVVRHELLRICINY